MYYYLAVTIITSGMRVAIRFLDETTCRTEKESMEVFAPLKANYKDPVIVPGNQFKQGDFGQTFLGYAEFKATQGVFQDSTAWIGCSM